MTLDDLLASVFPDGHDVKNDSGVLFGSGALRSGGRALVIGVADRTALGVDEAIRLSRYVLTTIKSGSGPILVIVDSDSQRMSQGRVETPAAKLERMKPVVTPQPDPDRSTAQVYCSSPLPLLRSAIKQGEELFFPDIQIIDALWPLTIRTAD